MIYPEPLNREQRKKTQKNYCCFAALNGVSYMCLGETIIVLFAIKLNAPNSMVASLGAIIYLAFFMLPIGKIVAARVGAARSQAVFWTLRNFMALLVALSAVTSQMGWHTLALVQIMVGACMFYGMRAAGVVMSQPYIGDMASEKERPQLVGVSNSLFYIGCMLALLVIWWILSISESVWVLTAIIIFGAVVGVCSTFFIRRMDESVAMIEAARRKVMPEIRESLKLDGMRKLICAMFTSNITVIMLAASSMLCIKRGYGVSDTAALFFSLMQFSSAALFSFLSGKLTARFGSRRMVHCSFLLLLTVPFLWEIAPEKLNMPFAVLIFGLIGGAFIMCNNSILTYYLQITPERLWVASSMLTSVVTSVGAGVIGMVLSSGIFRIIDRVGSAWEPLSRFKVYFGVAVVILLMLSYFIWSLPKTGKNQ